MAEESTFTLEIEGHDKDRQYIKKAILPHLRELLFLLSIVQLLIRVLGLNQR